MVRASDDFGATWSAPDRQNVRFPEGTGDALATVLRDALCTDGAATAGFYFGTRAGKLYGSADEGERWMEIADALPPVVCVRAAVVAER